MKILNLFAVVFFMAFSSVCCAEQNKSESELNPIEEIEVKELNFENLPEESLIGNLSEVIIEEESSTDFLLERIKWKKSKVMYPYSEGLSYINGQLCHVGNYSQSVIYTVLEGPYYGTQTTMTYDGFLLYVNYDYDLEYTYGGVVLHHYYSDSKVMTGSNQVIKFY